MGRSPSTAPNDSPTDAPDPPLRVAFFGSSDFALPSLRALVGAGVAPLLVVTQPDRPAGRGLTPQPTAVRRTAVDCGLPVVSPSRLEGDHAFRQRLRALDLDAVVVAAYGNLIPADWLRLPRRGFVNLHPSLLPRYRGATPIQTAIRNGDAVTGVTLMVLDAGLDTGPIVAQASVPIPADTTTPALSARLADAGAALLLENLPRYVRGDKGVEPQDDTGATITKPLTRQDGQIDWSQSASAIDRQVRAFLPWPGTWTLLAGHPLKVLATRVRPETMAPGRTSEQPPLRVGCGQGSLELLAVQFPAGKPLSGRAALTGHRLLGRQLGRVSGPSA